jgi:hypothetical protein
MHAYRFRSIPPVLICVCGLLAAATSYKIALLRKQWAGSGNKCSNKERTRVDLVERDDVEAAPADVEFRDNGVETIYG